jgi:AcrR family transcriptional regulator
MSPSRRASEEARASWEERSVSRVLGTGGGRVLARSHRFVQAGRELIAERGFEGLTLRAVLDRAQLSRRAFYERFDGKDDLVLAVFEQMMRDGAEEFRTAIAATDEPLERLRSVIEGMVMSAGSDAGLRDAVAMSREHLRLAEARPDDLRHALEPLTGLIAEQLALGMERGVVRKADPHELAILVHNLVSATIHASLLSGDGEGGGTREDRAARCAAALWDFCERAVRADPAGEGSAGKAP